MAPPHLPSDRMFIEAGGRQYGIDYIENREYGTFKLGSYLLPADDTERDRLDLMHTMLKTARPADQKLTHLPSQVLTQVRSRDGKGARVMDLGCGTGLWMLQMAEKFPKAEFNGYDLNYMLPSTLLSNIVPYVPFDIETPWNERNSYWDMIHIQMMRGSIGNWSHVFQQIKRHLAPGAWFESVEIDWQPRCDDNTMNLNPDLPGLIQWWQRIRGAYSYAHRPIEYFQNIERDLEAEGFKEIKHYKYQLPTCGWHSTDPVKHRVGSWWNIAMSPGSIEEGCSGLEAISLRPLLEFGNVGNSSWTPSLVKKLCDEALAEASNSNVHAYNELHIVIARAPHPDGT